MVSKGWWEVGGRWAEHRGLPGRDATGGDAVMVDTCACNCAHTHRMYTTSSEPVDCGLGVMRCVHQLQHMLHPGGGCACLGLGDVWETFIPFPQCCHESKTALKIVY